MLSNGASLSLERGKTPTDTTSVAIACLREKKRKYAGVLYGSLSEAGILNTQTRMVFKLVFFIEINSDSLYGGRMPLL
jgi:hypothetical protein